jgi:hypothetical protein
MKKYQLIFLAMTILLLGCKSNLDFDYDVTEIQVKVYDDQGELLNGALVKLFDSETAYELEKNAGNSGLEIEKGFTSENGTLSFGGAGGLSFEKGYFLSVSFRDRERFVDLDNFGSSFRVPEDYLQRGGKTKLSVYLQQAKSSVSFYSRELSQSQLPISIYIGGQLIGEVNALAFSEPSAPSITQTADVLSFRLSQGEQAWHAVSSYGCVWTGIVKVGSTEGFTAISLDDCDAGAISFWVNESVENLLPISVSIGQNDVIGSITNSSSPSSCFDEEGLSVSRAPGTYTYFAVSTNGNCTWSGSFTVRSAGCQMIELENCL